MDVDNDGFIDMTDIKKFYNGKRHPDVMQGKRSAESIQYEFFECFELHHRLIGRKEGKISLNEFMNFYQIVGCEMDSDE